MRKLLAVLAFTLVAACLIAPKFIAPKHQEKLVELISNLNNAPGYTATIVSTESAWFGSENKVVVTFDAAYADPTMEEGKLKAEFLIDTHYGPLLFSSEGLFGLYHTDIRFAGDQLRNDIKWDEDLPFYELSVLGGFTGHFKLADKIPSFSNPADTIQFSGYTGKGNMTDEGFSYQGNLDQIDLVDGYTPLKAEGFAFSVELNSNLDTIMNGGFYDSTTDLSLEKLTIGSDTEFSGLNIEAGSNLDQETQLGSIQVAYLIKSAIIGDLQANDLSFVTELSKVSNQFLIDYKAFSNTVLADSDSSDATLNALSTFIQDNIGDFLATKPELNITDFSGTFTEGSFKGTLTSKLADIETPTLDELFVSEFWLYNAIVNADIEADEALVRGLTEKFIASRLRAPVNAPEVKQQAIMFINGFVQQGWITLDGKQYKSEFSLKDGQGKINDFVFPLM